MSERLMSKKYPAAAATYDAAMTFEEIGNALGISKQAAYFLFVSGLKKLRRNPAKLREFVGLVEMRAALRSEPTLPDWNV